MITDPSVITDAQVGVPDLRTARFRRVASAAALPLAFTCQVLANTIYAVANTQSGLTDTGPVAEMLEMYARYPMAIAVSSALATIGTLAVIPGLLAALKLVRPARPRLGLWAVALMIAGYVCYFAIAFSNFLTIGWAKFAYANTGIDIAGATEKVQESLFPMPYFALFVVGNLIGTALLAIAVMRSSHLPRIAGILILGWPVGHIINLVGVGEWAAVAGGLLEVAGVVMLARIALRTPDAKWVALG